MVKEKPEYCKLEPNPGYGRAAHRMLYFNLKKNTCERFIYGGIPIPPANPNRFDSCEKCQSVCGNETTECIIKPDPEDYDELEMKIQEFGVEEQEGEKAVQKQKWKPDDKLSRIPEEEEEEEEMRERGESDERRELEVKKKGKPVKKYEEPGRGL